MRSQFHGPITIIPAEALRDQRPNRQHRAPSGVPLNAAYYELPYWRGPRQQHAHPYFYNRTRAPGPPCQLYSRVPHDMRPRMRVLNLGPQPKRWRPLHRRAPRESHGIDDAGFVNYAYAGPLGYGPNTAGVPPIQGRAHYLGPGPADRYPTLSRAMMKLAQIFVGAGLVLLILGPSFGRNFREFYSSTESEGQLTIISAALVALTFSCLFLMTIFYAENSQLWRNLDAFVTLVLGLAYFPLAIYETWFASCYPPYGQAFVDTCHITQWTVAAVLSYVNIFLYLVDFVLSFRVGVNLL